MLAHYRMNILILYQHSQTHSHWIQSAIMCITSWKC
uniref:Uncharacterized protein n=1 Tax=Anguilla anguilla TaxID=7936 RepID=A0A0E9W1R7_ANGAN